MIDIYTRLIEYIHLLKKSFYKLNRYEESESKNKKDINESSFNGELNYIDTSNNHEYF